MTGTSQETSNSMTAQMARKTLLFFENASTINAQPYRLTLRANRWIYRAIQPDHCFVAQISET